MAFVFRALIFTLIAAAVSGCQVSSFTGGSEVSTQADKSGYISSTAKIRVYFRDSGLTPLTELNANINEARLPSSIYDGPYGDRKDPSLPQPMNLIVKVYNEGFNLNGVSNGDFYFETPILYSDYEVNNVTTAMSWILQHGYNRNDFKISRNLWLSLTKGVEVYCQSCRAQTNTQTLNLIMANSAFMSEMLAALQRENPSLSINWVGFQNPLPLLAYVDPSVGSNRTIDLTAVETDDVSLKLIFINPLDSTTPVTPTTWSLFEPAGLVSTQSGGTEFAFAFSFQAMGPSKVTAQLTLPSGSKLYTFNFNVSNKDRTPSWSPEQVDFLANRVNTADLSDFCSDPDPGTVLSFQLVSGPPGLTIIPSGIMTWQPTQPLTGPGQIGDFEVKVECTDDDIQRMSSIGTVHVHVAPDHLPEFVNLPTPWAVVEGVPSSILIDVGDTENDPLQLEVTDRRYIRGGLPDGSGVFQVTKVSDTVFQLDFTPSYLQTVGADGSVDVTLSLHYDGRSGVFDPTNSVVTRTLTLNVTNTDDPPMWISAPPDQMVTEAVPFSGFSGGSAADRGPNQTTLTYSLDAPPQNCEWADLVVNLVTGEISGTPNYDSARSCYFRLVAKDAAGLTALSDTFEYVVENANRPIMPRAGAVTAFSVVERKPLQLDMLELFEDPDIDIGDPGEDIYYTCLNCVAEGATGFVLDGRSHRGSWVPNSNQGRLAPYVLDIEGRDNAGSTSVVQIQITVQDGAGALQLTTSSSLIEVYENTPPSNTSHELILTVTPASSVPIDGYPYEFASPISCIKIGGGSCRAGMIAAPAVLSGDGSIGAQEFRFNITPNATDGDAGYPDLEVNYLVGFQVFKSDDPTLLTEATVNIRVINTNRLPTQIGVGSLGAVAGPYINGIGQYSISAIDASRDRKIGSTWQTSYKIPFQIVDDDGSNDHPAYSLGTGANLGSFTDNLWTFKLPSCLAVGLAQASKVVTIQASDGRGGTVSREVKLTFRNVQAPSPGCL